MYKYGLDEVNILTKKKNFVYRGYKAIRKKENRG